MWNWNSIQESLKEFLRSLGKWGWAVLVGVLLTIAGFILNITNTSALPIWSWVLMGFVTILLASFISFHKLKVERDNLLNKANPKLVFGQTKENNKNIKSSSFGIEIINESNDTVEDCRGRLEIIELLNPQKAETMSLWPTKQPLKWADEFNINTMDNKYSISPNGRAILDVIYTVGWNINSTRFEHSLAYLNEKINEHIYLPNGKDILLVISITSKHTVPLYAICKFRCQETGIYDKFDLINVNLKDLPTIEQCRHILTDYILKNTSV